MIDDLAGKRTGERIQILRERRGLTRPVLAGLVGMSASWLKGIERGTRLPPRLPMLVKLAEVLGIDDVAALAGIDMELANGSIPMSSFARIPQEARNRAGQIDPESIPSVERRGRLGVEIARAYHQRRDYPAVLHWLEQACQTSRDSVRYSPMARQMAADVVEHGGALISRRARTLAGSIGLHL